MKYFRKIEGERLYLSPFNMEDVEVFTKWLNDKEICRNTHMTDAMVNLESEKDWIKNILDKGTYNFAIVLNDDTLIGNCMIDEINLIHKTATLGILIGEEEHRNKGYGKEVLDLLLDYGFNTLNLNNINLHVYSFNKRAIACYEKVGFKKYATRHECYYCDGKYHDRISMEYLKKDYTKE